MSWIRRRLVALRKQSLDQRLLAGERPGDSPDLAERRARLLDPRNLRRLADRLERVVQDAWKPDWTDRRSPRVPLRRGEIRRSRRQLLALSHDLREEGAPELRGVILTEHLVTDGGSPLFAGERLYGDEARLSVEVAVRQARTALHLR